MAVADDKAAGSFIKGAAILSAAGIISRFMGLGYRVILTRMIGAEGMGIYQMAYPLYTIMLVVSRSGIPVTMAKMIADRMARDENKDAYRVFTIARVMSVIIGAVFTLGMLVLAGPLIRILRLDPRAYYAILAIAPAIFLVSIMATYRGFFQGLQDMRPTAASQIVEQLIRTITMIGLAYYLLPLGLEFAAAGASFGAVTGAAAGLLLLFYIYFRRRGDIFEFFVEPEETVKDYQTGSILSEFARLGLPITFGALVRPLMNFVDWVFVPQRLQTAGFAMEEATTLYGLFTNVAMPLVNFPAIITVSLAASLVPAISEADALEDRELIAHRTHTALRFTLFLGLPSAVGLTVLARPLSGVIFSEPAAASILRLLAWGVIFITLQQTTSAVLQGIGRTDLPARNLALGAAGNAVLNYLLTGLPLFNIHGAAAATVLGFFTAAALNIISVLRRVKNLQSLRTAVVYPALSSLLMGAAVLLLHGFMVETLVGRLPLAELIILLVSVAAGAGIYSFFMLLSGALKYDDLILLPRVGENIAKFLGKRGVIDGYKKGEKLEEGKRSEDK